MATSARAETRRLALLYRLHFEDSRRERLFLASIAFFLAFAVIRLITLSIKNNIGPFQNVVVAGGTHIHHMVPGIFLLLVVGYLWLRQVGIGAGPDDRLSSVTAILYGVAAALTLDEFALWLNLEDVYWAKQGRQSVDAVILFGALLSVGWWGGPFFRAVSKEVVYLATHGTLRETGIP